MNQTGVLIVRSSGRKNNVSAHAVTREVVMDRTETEGMFTSVLSAWSDFRVAFHAPVLRGSRSR